MTEAILVLEDGRTFRGRSFGAEGEVSGELVLVTDAGAYQEALTDPTNTGKIVLLTFPHVGSTGWNDEDSRSERIQVVGVIVRDPVPRASNFRSTGELDDVLAAQGVAGICDIDTRAITRHIRGRSVRGCISTTTLEPSQVLARLNDGKDA